MMLNHASDEFLFSLISKKKPATITNFFHKEIVGKKLDYYEK